MHPEVLTDNTADLLPQIKQIKGYYLAGGTALALQIGHRISVDFDLFSEKKLAKNLLPSLEKVFKGHILDVRINNSDELTMFADGVKITFLFYPFKLLHPLVKYDGLAMAGIKEIAAMKAYTIGRRGSFKDYVDLYFITTSERAKWKCHHFHLGRAKSEQRLNTSRLGAGAGEL